MSKRVSAWLCLQVFAVSIFCSVPSLAQNFASDAPTSQTTSAPGGLENGSAPSSPVDPANPTNQSTEQATSSTSPVGTSASPNEKSINDSTSPPASDKAAAPNVEATQAGNSSQPKSNATNEPGLSETHAKPAEAHEKPVEETKVHPKPTVASPVASAKPTMLYGRIEQIADSAGAQFPVLKAETAKMDPRAPKLKGNANETALRGSVVSSFPADYSGTWGGSLTVWNMQMSPICWQTDPAEAKWTEAAMKRGLVGQANFTFNRDRAGKMELEPSRIAFAVPMKDTDYQGQMDQMLGGGAAGNQAGMSNFVKQFVGSMANSMTVPMILNLGNFQTSGMVTGVSGNELREAVLKNTIRELAQGVLEQQIVTSEVERVAKTGQLRYGYGESVIRFTRQTADEFYVQIATVNYTQDRRFRRKIILYGTVRRGQVVNDNPSPVSGLGNMLNPQGGGTMNIPQLQQQLGPGQNPFQNLQNLENLFRQ